MYVEFGDDSGVDLVLSNITAFNNTGQSGIMGHWAMVATELQVWCTLWSKCSLAFIPRVFTFASTPPSQPAVVVEACR